jgi:hypothetical protein
MEESCEAQTNRTGNEETKIKLESDSPCSFAYSVIFKEEHDEVKEEITEEEGEIYGQINEGEDRASNEGEDRASNEGEDQPTNEGEDLKVVEMKEEEEEDNDIQVP